MDRCAPGLACPGAASLFALPATPLVAGRARSGSGRSCDGGADLVRCESPVRARVRLLLLSLSGDGYPRCLFFSGISATVVFFVEPVLGSLSRWSFAANCRLQVECGCGNGRADKNGRRRSSPHYSIAWRPCDSKASAQGKQTSHVSWLRSAFKFVCVSIVCCR